MKTWKNSPKKLIIIHNQQFFLLPAWLPKRPIFGRNRNFIGSPCLLSTISLSYTKKRYLALGNLAKLVFLSILSFKNVQGWKVNIFLNFSGER